MDFPLGYRRCPDCGAANYGRMTNCLRCQSELPADPVAGKRGRTPKKRSGQIRARFCTRCGKALPKKGTVKFCRHCGQPVFVPSSAGG